MYIPQLEISGVEPQVLTDGLVLLQSNGLAKEGGVFVEGPPGKDMSPGSVSVLEDDPGKECHEANDCQEAQD